MSLQQEVRRPVLGALPARVGRWGAGTYLGRALEEAVLWDGTCLRCCLVVFPSDQSSETGGICAVAGQFSLVIVSGVVVVPFLFGSAQEYS